MSLEQISKSNRLDRVSPFRTYFILLIAFSLVSLVLYWRTLTVDFLLDDIILVRDNPLIHSFDYFLDDSGARLFAEYNLFRVRIFSFFTFALNYHLSGNNAIPYHVTNLFLHVINSLLVFSVSRHLFRVASCNIPQVAERGLPLALFVALLFLVHPLQTEAVNYLMARFTLLSSLFCLLSVRLFLAFRHAVDNNRKKTAIAFGAVLLTSMCLSYLSKQSTALLPLILVAIELIFYRSKGHVKVLVTAPWFLSWLIFPISMQSTGFSVFSVLSETSSVRIEKSLSMFPEGFHELNWGGNYDYFLTQLCVVSDYLRLLFLPYGQSFDHQVHIPTSFFEPAVMFCAFTLLLIIAAAFFEFVKGKQGGIPVRKYYQFGVAWFFLTLLVSSSVIPLPMKMAEYRVYLPSFGVFLFVVAFAFSRGVKDEARSCPNRYVFWGVVVLLVLSVTTYHRNVSWSSSVSIWEDAVAKAPDHSRALNHLGVAYLSEGKFPESVETLTHAISVNPSDPYPYLNLAIAYRKSGKLDEAIGMYRKALTISPRIKQGHFNLGNALMLKGEYAAAVASYNEAIKLDPRVPSYHRNISVAYGSLGQRALADHHDKLYRALLD